MKKGYLITAYDQPLQLARLIHALQNPNVVFYIYIDKKVPIGPFTEAIGSQSNVKIISSIDVTWMGFSQVQSTLEIMSEAAKEHCDYYTLLSGSDYPIKSNQYILDFFSNAKHEFINFWRLVDRPSWISKILYYYPIDWIPIWNYQSSPFRRYYWGYFYKLLPYMPHRTFLKGLDPYGGCGWWSLSHDCLTYILKYASENNAFTKYYKLTHCPIEMFFQTIILNSEWASRVKNYASYKQWSATTSVEDKLKENRMLPEDSFNYRYIDWSPERTGGLGRPATLNESDFEALRSSNNLFARKVDEKISRTLLDLIDEFRYTHDL